MVRTARPLMHLTSMHVVFMVPVLAGCLGGPSGDDEPQGPADTLSICIGPCLRVVDDSSTHSYESAIARNPTEPDNILIGSSSWKGTDPASGPVGLNYHVSFDGGASFESSPFPGDVAVDHPLATAQTFADPWVLFLRDGTALYSAMVGRGVQGPPEALVPAWESFDIVVARSEDGGLTWPEATFVSDTLGVTGFQSRGPMNDQPFMSVAPNGDVHIVWVLQDFAVDGTMTQNVASAVSTDAGRTWSEPTMVTDAGTFRGGRPAITDEGHLYVAMRDRGPDGTGTALVLASSTDGGTSWAVKPLDGMHANLPTQMAASGGEILLVYGQPDETGREDVHLQRSQDGGETWSDTVISRSLGPGPAIPAVVADPSGNILVTHYVTLDDGRVQPTVARIDSGGDVLLQNLTTAPLEPSAPRGVLGWPTYGDYQGLWIDEYGATASWLAGVAPDTDLAASFLLADPSVG